MLKFRTNAKCSGCVAAIGKELNKIVDKDDWSIDLSTPDRVLVVLADVSAESVSERVAAAGFKAEIV